MAEDLNNYSGLQSLATHSGIVDGEVVSGVNDQTVYVSSESDLSSLTGFAPGTIAVQYGFVAMWQKKPDGTWVSL